RRAVANLRAVELHDRLYKVLLVGDSGVGKSCLLMQFVDGCFTENYMSTIGVDFVSARRRQQKIKTVLANQQRVKLQIWDTAGQERFRTITCSYYRGARGVVVVFDLTNRSSFEHVTLWLRDVAQFAGDEVRVLLVGNKSDLSTQRVVAAEEAEELARAHRLAYVETSAKQAERVEDAFAALTSEIVAQDAGAVGCGEGTQRLANAFKLKLARVHTDDPGRMNMQKVAALGLKPGPLLGQLKARGRLTLLGTGAAVPGKFRNVSAAYCRLRGFAVLLDVGEGTLFQLHQFERFCDGADVLLCECTFENALEKEARLQSQNKTFLHEEYQYLDVLADILESGVDSDDRTSVGTRSKFGAVMRYDLRHSFPLLTTKKVHWKSIVCELLWFLNGGTHSRELEKNGVKIWQANGTREFLDSRGLQHYKPGELGPIYGFQWRHFGAQYRGSDADYSGQGVDQIREVLETIRREPTSRRIIFSAWNPAALHEMALPPCHVLSQFYIDAVRKEISCFLFQRSGDWGLGVPFNVASYSLLCHIIGKLTGYKPREFVHFVTNAHVYNNHKEAIVEQTRRTPTPFPALKVADISDIDSLKVSDFSLVGYHPQSALRLAMVA
uniref:Thymidylate synthase n=1 Tax=Dermatophagoides pteronyssinus TaxID=6956 RepID=A0A6P6YJI1_DERPT